MDILEKITKLRIEQNWSEYQLAENSGLTQSTISSWYRKKLIPSISSLEHICDAFGISLSQFFKDDTKSFTEITQFQQETLKKWSKLSKEQQKKLSDFLDTITN